MIAALGVVFGDIGTSPLYAMRESFLGAHILALNLPNLLGVLSLIIWSLILVIWVKYLLFVLRANNNGEGGIIALVALLNPNNVSRGGARKVLILMGLFGACLLYGDGTITPAISVLSAVEGLQVAAPHLDRFVVPITIVILIGLFAVQRFGSGKIGRWFGVVMLVWFTVLALLGVRGIVMEPVVLKAINPCYAAWFFLDNGMTGYLTLGAVFLVVTGGEALYADLGHFGKSPIRRAWAVIVFPALVLNYMGQAALLLHNPAAVTAPFFHLAPDWATIPLVLLATLATIIAAQAVISGTFSLTRQAIQLGQLPRMLVIFTEKSESGQIYLPLVNWLLMFACIGLVVGFRSSDAMASAYGLAVSLDMLITTILAVAVAQRLKWHPMLAIAVGTGFIGIDIAFLGANIVKIPDGGWYALLIASILITVMLSWRAGRALLGERLLLHATHQNDFIRQIQVTQPYRVKGTAVVLTGRDNQMIPAALMHHLACTGVLHEHIVFLTVVIEPRPHVPASERIALEYLSEGLVRMRAHFGFSQGVNIPITLKLSEHFGLPLDTNALIYILSRETLIARRDLPGLPYWQERIFIWLNRNAARATAYYHLPEEQVLEIGLQVGL